MIISHFFSSFAFNLFAMGAPAQQGEDPTRSMIMMIGPIVLMFGIFYLIAIRPQQKQQKELQKMRDSLKAGDRILLVGGIYGIVSQVKEKTVIVKIAENTKVEMLRSGIDRVLPAETKEEKKN